MGRLTLFMVGLLAALPAPGAIHAQGVEDDRGVSDVVAALSNARVEIARLESLHRIRPSDLFTVDVARRASDRDRLALLRLLEERADAIEAMRDAVDLSSIDVAPDGGVDRTTRLERALADRGVAVRDILAVEVEGDRVFVYHADPATLTAMIQATGP